MMRVRRDELVNPALIQQIRQLQGELQLEKAKNAKLATELGMCNDLIRCYRKSNKARYEREIERRKRGVEISVELIVAGIVVLVVTILPLICQDFYLTRWGLMP